MHYDISFPHLGIHLEHVGKPISIFGFEIAYYGIIIGTAILLGFVIATAEAKRTGQDPENYLDMGMIGVVFGIIGARFEELLQSSSLSIQNIAYSCGYSSSFSFSKAFRKVNGLSPSEYRKQKRGG